MSSYIYIYFRNKQLFLEAFKQWLLYQFIIKKVIFIHLFAFPIH